MFTVGQKVYTVLTRNTAELVEGTVVDPNVNGYPAVAVRGEFHHSGYQVWVSKDWRATRLEAIAEARRMILARHAAELAQFDAQLDVTGSVVKVMEMGVDESIVLEAGSK